jgi:prolyl oligopeptidase PreP (S9A serine peptidase family)
MGKMARCGTKMQKQNVFDDFIAAAEYLIAQKYTSSDFLAIRGSNEVYRSNDDSVQN